jgi:asparagine synthase (glutamine-hydrolysing)
MSGFAGVVSLDGAPPDAGLLARMAQTLAFRGPDGTHIATKPGAGFCFTFLRTGPAPQCSAQPRSLDGRIWLLGDVRLDGRDDLRRKLEQHGDEFDGDTTDEELILRAWRRWREDSLPDLIGDYSFALWDSEARHLWCARDLMGARPFFYARAGDRLYFSNTLNTIRCAPDISTALDDHFIGDFLLDGWSHDSARTAFREVSRLTAGHVMSLSDAGINVRRFTYLPIEEPLYLKGEDEYIERFHELLSRVVHERLPSSHTAISLSGGLDSTSVAALAQESARERRTPFTLSGYTLDYRPLFDDQEGRFASLAAQHLGIPIKILPCASTLPFATRSLPHQTTPEPCHEPYSSACQQQSEDIAKHARIVLTGNGGDGILTGQAWPYLLYILRRADFRSLKNTFGRYILKHRRIPPLRGGFRSSIRRLTRRADPMADYPVWLNRQFESDLRLPERWLDLGKPIEKIHPWYPNAYSTLTGAFWPALLESEDAAWSKVALESRAPLLDVRISRFLLRVPPVPLCMDKELLRRAVDGLLPEQIRLRPKTPFAGDQIALQIKNGSWSAFPLPAPIRAVSRFVDWERLKAALQDTETVFPWMNLRPISLLYWLRVIETD